MIEYILLGVFAPIILNLMHLVLGIWITVARGSVIGLGFSALGFVTKTIGMIFFTWLGVVHFELVVGIYIPILTFFWFFTHVIEGVIIQHYMERNVPEWIQKLQIK
tara:strand:+ start:201 stop:518 length:318 start_codon:yes stop_codon:yes gene_type:complete